MAVVRRLLVQHVLGVAVGAGADAAGGDDADGCWGVCEGRAGQAVDGAVDAWADAAVGAAEAVGAPEAVGAAKARGELRRPGALPGA